MNLDALPIPDPYAVLGLGPGADDEQIRAAYLTKLKQFPPDVRRSSSSRFAMDTSFSATGAGARSTRCFRSIRRCVWSPCWMTWTTIENSQAPARGWRYSRKDKWKWKKTNPRQGLHPKCGNGSYVDSRHGSTEISITRWTESNLRKD